MLNTSSYRSVNPDVIVLCFGCTVHMQAYKYISAAALVQQLNSRSIL